MNEKEIPIPSFIPANNLAIIGASFLQRPLVTKAKEMGLKTHCFAWDQGAACKEICDTFHPISIVEKEAILEVCRKLNPVGIVTIASDVAVPTVNYVAKQLGLVGNSEECTQLTTNKYDMRRALNNSGLLCPRFAAISQDKVKIAEKVGSDLSLPVIVKPTDRSGSKGVQLVAHMAGLKDAVQGAISESFEGRAIVEQFIEGHEISVETISWKGHHRALAITDKETSGPPFFVETGHCQPATLDPELQKTVREITFASLDALAVEYGASHVELMITRDNQIVVTEIGSRMGGDFIGSTLVELSTGFDFVRGVIDISRNRFQPPGRLEQKFSGVRFLFAEHPGVVQSIGNNAHLYDEIVHQEVFVKPGDHVAALRESRDRLGYFIYSSRKGQVSLSADRVFDLRIS